MPTFVDVSDEDALLHDIQSFISLFVESYESFGSSMKKIDLDLLLKLMKEALVERKYSNKPNLTDTEDEYMEIDTDDEDTNDGSMDSFIDDRDVSVESSSSFESDSDSDDEEDFYSSHCAYITESSRFKS